MVIVQEDDGEVVVAVICIVETSVCTHVRMVGTVGAMHYWWKQRH